MSRRRLASTTRGRASSHVSFADVPPADTTYQHNLTLLRRHWKWANFSQFFYTFAQLLSVPDVSLTVSLYPSCFAPFGLHISRTSLGC